MEEGCPSSFFVFAARRRTTCFGPFTRSLCGFAGFGKSRAVKKCVSIAEERMEAIELALARRSRARLVMQLSASFQATIAAAFFFSSLFFFTAALFISIPPPTYL